MAASPAQAACQSTLDFSGAAINDNRTLDVSTCSIDIRWGLYRDQGDDALGFFPVSGNAPFTAAPDAAVITLPTGAQLRFTPLSVIEFTDPLLGAGSTLIVNSYRVTLVSTGTGANSTATLYYATNVLAQNAANVNPIPANTAYPIAVTFSASAPEIAVSGNIGGAVLDGQTSAQGNQTVGTPVTVTYTVTNTGSANLTLATATAASASGVTVGNITAPVSTTVAGGGGTTTFQVTYTPTAAGAFSFNLSFTNNDSDENPFNFTVSGTGVAPAPSLTLSAAPSAAEQTVGRNYSFTVTPGAAAGGGDTSGTLTLTTTLPAFQAYSTASGTGWSCNVTGDIFSGETVTCTSTASIAAGTNGNPVTISITPAGARNSFAQAFTLSGGGAASPASATASTVAVNGLPQTSLAVGTRILIKGIPVSEAIVTRRSGGTAPFAWSISPLLPAGLSFDNTTGIVSGTPTAVSASTSYTVTVTDARGAASSRSYFLSVIDLAPTVTAVSPAFDNIAGGKAITITGTNFTGATKVSFGTTDVLAANFTSISDTQIVLNAPARAAGTVNVTVTTAGGVSSDTAADDFEYGTAPVPAVGAIELSVDYDAVSIETDLAASFTGAPTGGYLLSSGTQTSRPYEGGTLSITSTTLAFARPSGFRGRIVFPVRAFNKFGVSQPVTTVITVRNPSLVASLTGSGAQQGVALSGYSIQTTGGKAPYRCATSPATGSLPAGVSINANCTLSGTPTQSGTFDFTLNVTDSSVGPEFIDENDESSFANPFTQRSGTLSLVVAAPALTVAAAFTPSTIPADGMTQTAYSLTFTNTGSSAAALSNITLTFDAAINRVSPGTSLCGGTLVENTPGLVFTLVGSVVPANGTCAISLPFTMTAPGDVTARANVSFNGSRLDVPVARLTVTEILPTVTAVSPDLGPVAGGTAVTITGTNFTGATGVSFGGVAATGFTVNPAGTQITVNAPAVASAGTVNVTVTTPGGASADNGTNDDFVFISPPTATAEFLQTSILGNGSAGAQYRVTVTNPNSVALTGIGFSQVLPPNLNAVSIAVNNCGGGANIIDAGGYTFLNRTLSANASCVVTVLLTSTVPSTYSLTLTTLTSSSGDGALPTTATPLTVTAPAPTVTAVSPAFDNIAGGKSITITGTNFTGATGVSFGGVAATGFTVNPAGTQITVNAPPVASAGPVQVSVTTAGGTSADTAADDFEYGTAPVRTTDADGSFIGYGAANPFGASVAHLFTGAVDGYYLGSGTDVAATIAGVQVSVSTAGVVTFNRPSGYRGLVTANVRAFNKFGASQPLARSLTVNDPTLDITLIGSGAQQGAALSGYSVQTTGGTGPYSCAPSGSPGVLPLGVTLNADCTLTGTPLNQGNFSFRVDVTDSSVGPAGANPFTKLGADTLNFVVAPALAPTITAAFSPTSIPADGTTEAELTLTIVNPNAFQLTGVAFASAALPANLVGAGATSSCGGTAAYSGVNGTLAFSGGTLAGNGTCTVKLPVRTTVAGLYNYTTGAVSSTQSGAGLTATTATGLTAVATPASVAVVSGSGQTAAISTGFANPLVAIVRDFANNPMQGVTVNFAGPNAGASAVLGSSSAVTGANGQASVTATANATAGTYDVVATVTGVATGANFNLFNDRAAQTILFTAPAAQTFAPGGTVGLTATGGASGNPVTFASTTTAVCTTGGTNGATVTFVSAGNCSITASQAGNDNYFPATGVTRSFDIGKASQTILFTAPAAQTFAPGGTVALSATGGGSGNPVTFASNTAAVCTTGGANGATVTFAGAGECSITASQAGNDNYNAAMLVTASFTIGKASQTIVFAPPAAQTFAPGGTVALSATGGGSGNPVTFASNSAGVCTVSGSTVTFQGAGTCSITASQAGNDNYNAATAVTESFAIGKASQSIAFTPPAAQTFAPGGTVALSATGGGSGNPVAFASNSAGVCTVSGSTVTFQGAGECSITASQAGNANYEAAMLVTASFSIGKAGQTISFTAPTTQNFRPGGTVALSATGGGSGNPVSFASNSAAVCTVSGSTVSFAGAGNCSITASQAGNANYEDAKPVTESFAIVDSTAPVFDSVPANIVVATDPGKATANVTFAAPTADDDLDGAVTPVQTAGLPSGADFPVGVTTNAYRATDAARNLATASFTVTVTDGEAPVLTVPADITVSANGVASIAVNYAAVTAADAVDGALVPVLTAGLASGAQFPLGETIVTYSATDSAGNVSTASFKVTVNDAARPSALISGAPSSVTANQAFTVTVAFDEPVTGFDVADVTVANGVATGVAAGAAANSFAVTVKATGGGDVAISIPENAAFDVASNGNMASNTVTVKSTVVEETLEAIADAVTDRMHLLVSNQPDLLLNVFNPSGIGGGDLGYMAIDGDPDGMTFAFATSLGHFDRAIAKGLAGTMAAPQAGPQSGPLDAAASVQERILGRDVKGERQAAFGRGDAMAAAPGQTPGQGVDGAADIAGPQRNYDLWVNIQGARSSATGAGGTDLDSSYWIGSFGGHWFVNRDLAIGALAQFDQFEQENGSTGAAFGGSGWMAGPYAAGRLPGTNLSWSARASWGGSDNDITPLGTYTDSFSTSRFYAQGVIAGDYEFARWKVTPKLQVDWYEETQDSYRDTLGNIIPEQQFSLGELTFGPSFSRSLATDGVTVTPKFGVTGVWTFAKEQGALTTASPAEGDMRARLDASLAIAATDGWQLYFGGYLDGLFLDDYQSAGGTVTLKKAF